MRAYSRAPQKNRNERKPSRRWRSQRGYSLHDVLMALLATAVLSAMAIPVGRSSVADYQLNSAAELLSRDLERARLKALDANGDVALRRESDGTYSLSGKLQRLPHGVSFSISSADSVVFNRFGAVSDGVATSFVLTMGIRSRELRIRAAGAVEVRR